MNYEKLKEKLLSKEVLLYLVFGVLTTLVNIIVFTLLYRTLGVGTVASNVAAWVLSVLFAYVTNRTFVFESKAAGAKAVIIEAIGFFSGRIMTGLLDTVIMYVSVDILAMDDLVMKILSNVLVVILNYVISKFIVFRRKQNAQEADK